MASVLSDAHCDGAYCTGTLREAFTIFFAPFKTHVEFNGWAGLGVDYSSIHLLLPSILWGIIIYLVKLFLIQKPIRAGAMVLLHVGGGKSLPPPSTRRLPRQGPGSPDSTSSSNNHHHHHCGCDDDSNHHHHPPQQHPQRQRRESPTPAGANRGPHNGAATTTTTTTTTKQMSLQKSNATTTTTASFSSTRAADRGSGGHRYHSHHRRGPNAVGYISKSDRKRLTKFTNQAWLIFYYCFSSLFGYYVLRGEPFFKFPIWPSDGVAAASLFSEHPARPSRQQLFYYNYEMGFYICEFLTLFVNYQNQKLRICSSKKSAVSFEVAGHHMFTLILLFCSHLGYFHRTGSYILFIHDVSDVFLCVSKCVVYLQPSNERIVNVTFFIFMLMFIFLRLICFPVLFVTDITVGPKLVPCSVNFWILMYVNHFVLQTLQLYWFFLMVKIANKVLWQTWKKRAKDIRSSSSSSSEPELEEEQEDEDDREKGGNKRVEKRKRQGEAATDGTAPATPTHHHSSNGSSVVHPKRPPSFVEAGRRVELLRPQPAAAAVVNLERAVGEDSTPRERSLTATSSSFSTSTPLSSASSSPTRDRSHSGNRHHRRHHHHRHRRHHGRHQHEGDEGAAAAAAAEAQPLPLSRSSHPKRAGAAPTGACALQQHTVMTAQQQTRHDSSGDDGRAVRPTATTAAAAAAPPPQAAASAEAALLLPAVTTVTAPSGSAPNSTPTPSAFLSGEGTTSPSSRSRSGRRSSPHSNSGSPHKRKKSSTAFPEVRVENSDKYTFDESAFFYQLKKKDASSTADEEEEESEVSPFLDRVV